jgi:transposase
MDETILTSIPPLRARWVRQGTQSTVPIIGDHTRRILYGTMSLRGGLLIQDTSLCNQEEFQLYLRMIRSCWRGWHLVLFLDRAPSHRADESICLAHELGIALRWLPVACPKLNPMDHLWRHIKGDVLANTSYPSLDEGVEEVYRYLHHLGRIGWMRKAGLFSETFWLREYVPDSSAMADGEAPLNE